MKETVRITHLGPLGDGAAAYQGETLYIPRTAPGDTVEFRPQKTGGKTKARQVKILQAAQTRQTPPCPYFEQCGGCSLQHLNATLYADWKREKVADILAHHHLTPTLHDLEQVPASSRRRLGLSGIKTQKGLTLGLHAAQSKQIVDIDTCLITHADLNALIQPLKNCLAPLLENGQKCGVHLTLSDAGVDVQVEAHLEESYNMRSNLADFAAEHNLARLILHTKHGEDPILIKRPPFLEHGGISVPLPAGAFMQASKEGEAFLRQKVMAAIPKQAHTIADLFSGLGTFALPLMQEEGRKISTFEAELSAVEALRSALASAAQHNVLVQRRDLFMHPLTKAELAPFDALIFDPPRIGAAAQCFEIAQSDVPVVVGISCNPATFARDAATLVQGGYRLTDVYPLDQFTWSAHVELVGIFNKN